MEFKYPDVNEHALALSHSSTNSSFFTGIRDGRLRPELLDPQTRRDLREAILWEMEKERKRSEIIAAEIVDLRTSASGDLITAAARAKVTKHFKEMSTGEYLSIQPSELKFQFQLRKQSLCSMQLANRTDRGIAFKVKTTNPMKYCVRPNTGVVLPNTRCSVIVTMQAQKEAPPDMQCRDKFLVQSVVVSNGVGVTPEMFNKEEGKVVNEYKIRVVYIPANPRAHFSGAASRSLKQSMGNSEAAIASKWNEEKSSSAIRRNEKLPVELELLRKQTKQSQGKGVSITVVLFVLLLGILLVYFIRA